MLLISHRVNTIEHLERTPAEYGVELDLRDRGDRLILQHDPFSDGENFEDYLRHWRHRFMILNVKSERIEHRALELVQQAGIENFFVLDSSFPMIRLLASRGERRQAVRFSEFEPVESALALAGQVEWAWIDCFTRMPLDDRTYRLLKANFKLCAVSPELQGRDPATIAEYRRQLAQYPMDAVCTKRPEMWSSRLAAA